MRDGVVTEGAASTIFAVVDGILRTHPLGHRILPSVTRFEPAPKRPEPR